LLFAIDFVWCKVNQKGISVDAKDQFSTLDIVKAFKIPRERLREWVNRGFVHPTIPSKGLGTKAIFSRSDIYLIILFQRLLSLGLKRAEAAQFLHFFKDLSNVSTIEYLYFRYGNPLAESTLPLKNYLTPLFFWADPEPNAHLWGFSLESGCFSWHPDNQARKDYDRQKAFPLIPEAAEEWDCILLINLKKIRHYSDRELVRYAGYASADRK
jgi:DNA-binding transcriptional MerR regulator